MTNSSVNGGMVYENKSSGVINYCISSDSNFGIAYYNIGDINYCINNSDLTTVIRESDSYLSGIASHSPRGNIRYCVNNGDINAKGTYTGGITSSYDCKCNVIECVNNGNITAGTIASGISNGNNVDCINNGTVYSYSSYSSYSNGIGGYALNCVNTGAVLNNGWEISSNAVDCYYLSSSGVDKGGALTEEEMQSEENFPVLDFKNTWQITEDGISLQCTNQKQIGIAVYTMPSKTYYNLGDNLDTSSLEVMTFDNMGNWRLTDDYTVSGFSSKALGKKTVKVNSGSNSATFDVYVRDEISHANITLSGTKFTATGKAIKPTVKVVSKDGTILKLNTDYTLTYASNTNPGTATITVQGKGLYTGSVKKTYTIIPMQVKGLKASAIKTKSISLTWTKQGGVTGYVVQKYDSKNKAWKTYKTITSNTNSITVSNLSPSTTYKFRVCSYKTISSKKYYGSYSSTLTTTALPPSVSVTSSKIYKHHDNSQYSIKWKKCANVTGYQIQAWGYGYNNSTKKWENYWKTIATVKGASKTSYTSKWRYDFEDGGAKIRIRAYKELDGKKYYGAWTTPKTSKAYK
jgi:hypothetical protein